MIGAELFIFGYHVYSVAPSDTPLALMLLMKNNIHAVQIEAGFAASMLEKRKIEALLGTRVKFKRSEMKGVGGMLVSVFRRGGVIAALLMCFALAIISSELVWDVRIEGNTLYSDAEIISELSEAGLTVGKRWRSADLGKIENTALLESDRLSWININRRGTVAYVKVIEKKEHNANTKLGYSNVVASCDAVIEEISVISGVARVKVGDTVRAGDLLISGVINEEYGGGFCYAEGVVRGRVSDTVSVFVSENSEKKQVVNEYLSRIGVKIFNFSINIFKSYRNFNISYDIIESEKKLTFLGRELPFSVITEHRVEYETRGIRLSRDELASIASARMRDMLLGRTEEATLLRAATSGRFTEGGYESVTKIVCIENIAKDVPFEYSASGLND